MIEDNPRMNELEELIRFCGTGHAIYIYQHDLTQKLISKYLWMSEISIKGFIMPEVREKDTINEPFPIIPLGNVKILPRKRNIRIIVAEDDCVHNQIANMFKAFGVTQLFFVSEWNRRTFVKKMMPRALIDFYLEVNLADHCNLNCQCCDHFSPIADKVFLDYDQYVKDIHRLAELTDGKIGLMKLQGGEPLLNDRVLDYMRVTRECFPESHICLFTDGLLLPKLGERKENNFWNVVREYEIEVRMTRYPIPMDENRIIEQAQKHGVPVTLTPPPFEKGARLWIFSEIGALSYTGVKHSVKHPFDLTGHQEKYRWISCYQFNESIVLRDGKIYTCPMIPYAHYFNKRFGQHLEVKDDCYIDIYKVGSFLEIAEFCTHRTSFCNYCAVHKRFARPWKQSEHTTDEWTL